MIKIDLTHSRVNLNDLSNADMQQLAAAHLKIHSNKTADDNIWVELPNIVDDTLLANIKKTAKQIRDNFDVLFVIGVGGSFAGAFSATQWFYETGHINGTYFPVEYIGISFDPNALKAVLDKYKGKRICVNVISKSGTTLETISTLNAALPYVSRIIATTGADTGYLRAYVVKNKLQSFEIQDGVGGRYSMLGSVGYLPMAVAGIDIDKVHKGAKQAYKDFRSDSVQKNEAYKYAAARYLLYKKQGKAVEIFASFFEGLEGFGRWWQQLFGESEGKQGKGLLPIPLVYSRDLHSMGQYVQQGAPIFFETILDIANSPVDVTLNTNEQDNMLKVPHASLAKINRAALGGTVKAHSASLPVVLVQMQQLDETGFGYLIYFFEIACAMSAMLLGVNPFDQPGVESYKKHMRDELSHKP